MWPDHGGVFFCNPCRAALQICDYAAWLQFLVRPLLLEQWGLEAQGEIWYQGKGFFT